jgi:phage terminase large subunit GpA-like protein
LWVERGDAPDWQRLYERREEFAAPAPAGTVILTAGIDVQQDRIEAYVWGWGRGLDSWLVDRLVTSHGPDTEAGWAELEAFLGRSWRHEGGSEITIARACIDTGYNASTVYAWVRKQDQGRIAAVKGEQGFAKSSPVTGPTYVDVNLLGKRVRRGAKLWLVAVSMLKSETYRFFRLDRPTDEDLADGAGYPAGTIHLPTWADSEVAKQLTAEQLVSTKTKRGYGRMEWQKLRERNEALDCRVYARAGAHMLGLDRWTPEQWTEASDRLIAAPAQPKPKAAAAAAKPGWLPRPAGKKWI